MLPHIGESAPVPESLHGRNTAATTPIPNGEDWFCLLPASALPHLPTIVSRISLPRPPPESSSPSTSTLPSSYGPVQMATIPSMPVSGFTIPPGALQMYLPAYPRLHPAPLPQSRYYIVPLRGQPAGPGQGSVSDGQQEPSILEASSSSTAGTANQQAPVSGTQERPKRVIHRRKSAKPRSCMHCRSEQCAGKWGISKCPVLQAKTQAG
ncbi:hypothetical protein OE88DRAFT_1392617 [Heliocybe sulcata]|uniref:Uncharacterized protein n=1 Tax=Heliocybe sulcata TaxID=5364 RepID=A0A5C3N5N6_9AGAM|nr:hypothetical protein OE88DRAFT_1392617 [Heliocybe sulcata]